MIRDHCIPSHPKVIILDIALLENHLQISSPLAPPLRRCLSVFWAVLEICRSSWTELTQILMHLSLSTRIKGVCQHTRL